MRYLGIDYGTKRVGLSISDEDGKIAFPYSVLSCDANLLSNIMDICQKEAVGAIVIGESKDFKGNDNFIMNDVRKLAKALETKVGISVFLEPEFLTSRQAAQIQGVHSKLDASSAAIILQSYLDKQTYRKSQMN